MGHFHTRGHLSQPSGRLLCSPLNNPLPSSSSSVWGCPPKSQLSIGTGYCWSKVILLESSYSSFFSTQPGKGLNGRLHYFLTKREQEQHVDTATTIDCQILLDDDDCCWIEAGRSCCRALLCWCCWPCRICTQGNALKGVALIWARVAWTVILDCKQFKVKDVILDRWLVSCRNHLGSLKGFLNKI